MPWQIICTDSEILAIHAALLPIGARGQIVLFGGDEHNDAQAGRDNAPANPAQVDNTRIHDLDSNPGAVTTIGSPTTDVFCSSHAFLGDGRLLIGGGTESWEGGGGPGGGHVHGLGNFGGHPACWVFNFRRRTWQRIADFTFVSGTATGEGQGGGRWYPTLLTLPSGEVIAFSGHPSRRSRQWHNNNIPEIYSPASNSWRRLARHDEMTFYPRMHLVRGNQIFIASGTESGSESRFFDLNTEALTSQVINRPFGGFYNNWSNTSVLLPLLPTNDYAASVLMCNDLEPIRIDLGAATPTWQVAGTRPTDFNLNNRRRQYACSTILPNGTVLVNGGFNDPEDDPAEAVNEVEIYDPGIDWTTGAYISGNLGSWSTRTPPGEIAQVPRNYHSTALLLPDGSVWTAGSSKGSASGDPLVVGERRIEIYEPDYFANPARPDLTNAPTSIDYNSNTFNIRTPQRNQIQRVALIRCGSATHAGDFDQRYVGCSFTPTGGVADGLTVQYPTDASVLPPGYYMLWIVNNAGLPCKNAKFIRVANRGIRFLLDHSTFSSLEVEALLSAGSVARFSKALYVVLDGYLPSEVGSVVPSVQLLYDFSGGAAVPNAVCELNGGIEFEQTPPPDDAPQRMTFAFDVVFSNMDAFSMANLPATDRAAVAVATFGNHQAAGNLRFTRNPNPYMNDGSVEWLSTDVRVFKIRLNQQRGGVTHSGNANQFIRDLLQNFNSQPDTSGHPFLGISTDQDISSLDIAGFEGFPPLPVFNYAVAKVRYRALSTAATDVQVFFRMFQAGTTDVSFNETTTYRRVGNGAAAVPLLGKFGPTIASIPFFADERVDSAASPMTGQSNATNLKTLPPNSAGAESVVYFGCWLDINQPTLQYPLFPTNDGPFPVDAFLAFPTFNINGRLSIQQLMRGTHQCLVAEIHFLSDLIPFGATPGSNDNLSQRNIVFDPSDNPGSLDSHIASHPFELKPSSGSVGGGGFSYAAYSFAVPSPRQRFPDELIIHWGNLPRDSVVSVYLPAVFADDVLTLQNYSRLSLSTLEKTDDHTLRCAVAADITYIPIPPTGKPENLTGLLTVELPDNVVKDQVFHVVIQQVEGGSRRIIGTYQMTVPVGTASLLLPDLSRKLSVLKHIQLTVPPNDRWYGVFNRYVNQFAKKVKAIGGDPDSIAPSSSGLGTDETGVVRWTTCLTLQWIITLLLALLCVVVALLPATVAAVTATVLVVALLAAIGFYLLRCHPDGCAWLKIVLIALNTATAILCAAHLLAGISTGVLITVICVLGIVNFILLMAAIWKKCCFNPTQKC
jgi:hypothetical protein